MIFTASNLNFAYDQKAIIKNWNSSLPASRVCHLQGPNGSGKSTLLRLFAGILKPLSGEINVEVSVAYVGHQWGLHPDLTIIENLSLGIEPAFQDWSLLLKETQMLDYQDVLTRILSVGQKQKIALIRMILQNSKVWLMDEPFANLDKAGETWLWSHIERHVALGGSVIFTAHQREFLEKGVISWPIL